MSAPGADPGQRSNLLRFGTFELDLSGEELRRAGALVKLQSQHFQLLVLLVKRAGQVVTREEIRETLWGDQTFVDFDRGINFCVNQIRVGLDDDPRNPRYVETLPRKGYRFIAPVAGMESTEARTGTLTEDVPAPVEASKSVVAPRPIWRQPFFLVGALAAAILLVIVSAYALRTRLLPSRPPIQSLAVLPLENLSHDPEQEYFADGMTDELIAALAKMGDIRVISRTSIAPYKGSKKPLSQIARELHVDAVVEGTVLRDHDRVRITAELIRVSPEQNRWAHVYEGSVSEIFTLRDTIAQAVARAAWVEGSPHEQVLLTTPRPVNPKAYDAYLRGRYFIRIRTEENLQKSNAYFNEAIESDTSYAPAWSGLAHSYQLLASFGVMSPGEAYPRARAAAEKAAEIDNNTSEAFAVLGDVKVKYEWDWAGAERLYKRAIALHPDDPEMYDGYSIYLAVVGRHLESVTAARQAQELEPSYPGWDIEVGWLSYFAHQYDQAERQCLKSVEAAPDYSWGHVCLGAIYMQTGRQQQGLSELRKALVLSGHAVRELGYVGHALGVLGTRAEAQKILDELRDLSAKRVVPDGNIALVYEGMGDHNHALELLEKACRERSLHPWVYMDPRFDPIRSDPRFKSIVRRMGLLTRLP